MKKTFAIPAIIAALAALFAIVPHASANGFPTRYWLGSNGTLWTAGDNWSSTSNGTTPASFFPNNYIVFSATGSSNETSSDLGGDQTISRLTIDTSNDVGISGGNLTINGTTTQAITVEAGNLTISSPLILAGSATTITANQSTSIATITAANGLLTNGSSTISISNRVWVSELGGSLDVESGTLQLADGLSSGVGTSNETITVNGTGSINSTTTINVGYDGDNNSLSATSGGSVIAPSIWIGGQAGADDNSVNASGTGTNLVSTSSTVVGYAGSNNTLSISGGATSGGTAAHIYIGYESTANNNTAIVTGANSTWSTTGAFIVGNNGTTNSLAVEDGGQVLATSQDIQIGFNAGSNNNALTVNGTGSLVSNNATVYVGNNGNNNSLSVTNGGNLTTFNTRIGGGAASNNNTLTISDAGSVWNNAGSLRVGSSGSGNALNITNGANATIVGNMFLGYSSGSANNTVTVNGTDSALTAGNLTVGRQGSGTLAVNNGGKVIILGGIEKGNASTVAIGQGGTLQLGNGGAGGLLGISALQSNGTIIVNSSSSYTYNGSISGSGNFIKDGTGTLTVTGNQTYSGGTAVNGGTLALGSSNLLLNTGNLSLGGGSFDIGAFLQTLKNVTLSSGSINGTGGTITAQTYAVESGLASANLAGNASLTKSTAGTVTLSGSNTYNGTTSINAGILELGNASGFGSAGNITFGGGTLQYGSGITEDLSSRIKNSASAVRIDTNGGNVTFWGSINSTNSGGLTKLGNGTLSLNGNNTFTGGTFIESGTLTGNSLGVKGNISNNATLQLASDSYVIEVSGSGALLVSESSNSVLLGNATMSGGTNIQSGFLTIGGRNSAQIFILGSINGNIANEGGLRFDMNTGNRTYSGVISGNGSLSSTSSGYGTSTGILYLTGNNTFTGGATWSHGTLDISGGTLASTGNVTISGGFFDIGASNQTIGNFKINGLQTTAAIGSGSLTASSYDLQQGAVSLALSGTAGLAKNTIGYGTDSYQNGVVHLSGNNNATGNITISSGILSFNTVQSLYSGNNSNWTKEKISVSANATLALGTGNGSATSGFNNAQIAEIFANLTQNATGGLSANSSIGFNVSSGNFTLNSTITDRIGVGAIGLDKIGSGALVLGAQNTFTGPLNIYEGIVRAGTNNALSTNSSLVVTTKNPNSVASYDIGNFTQQFVNVTLTSGTLNGGTGTINATGNYTMIQGDSYANLADVAPLLKTGSGIVYLYGNSTYTGHTTINGTSWSGQFNNAPTSSDSRLQFQNPGSLYTDNASKWNGGNITVNQYGIFSVRADDTGAQGFTENRIATLITNLISANRTSGGLLAGSAFGIDTAGTNMTLSTAFTDSTGRVAGGGAIGFVKYGTGTLTLNGTNNTHSLVTSVTGGTLALAPGTTLSASGANLSVQNAALNLGTTNQTVGSVYVSSGSILGSGTLTSTAGGFSFAGANVTANLAGSAGAWINFPGTTILSGSNSYSGQSVLGGSATLSLANINALAGSTLVHNSSGSSVLFSAGTNTYNFGGLSGSQNLNFGANSLSIGANNESTSYGSSTGILSGSGSVTKVGNGTLTFAGNNTYTGGTTISAGTLALGNGGTSGSVTGNITNNAALVFNRSGNTTYSDTISGSGNVTKNGYGTLTLSGNNTYTGNTTVNSGTLSLNGSLASTDISIASGAGLNTSGGLSQNSAVANAGNFTVNAAETIGSLSGSGNTILNAALTTGALGNPGNPDQISGIISGNGAITFNSIPSANRASALTANNTYTGSTTVSNSTLILSGNGSIASSSAVTLGANANLNINSVTASSSTVNNLSSLDSTAFIELGSKTLIDIATDNRTFSGTIGSANPGGFTKRGNGTLTLAGNNDYFGATTIEAGILYVTGSLFGTSPWSAPTAVSVSSGATYKLGSNDTVASIAGAGSINLDSYALTLGVNSTTASTTFSGVVSGANGGRLIKAGTGTLTLSGNNTYTGGTTISAGTLAVSSGGSISHTSNNTVIGANSGDNATLTINGGSVTNAQGTIGRDAGSTGVVNLSSGNWTNTELRIGNSGNGTLNLTGGTLFTSGNWTYIGMGNSSTGVANVSGGNWTNASELQVGSSGNGTLNITGGTVTNVAGFVATFDGSTGVVNVSGGNWTNTDRLRLGRYGNGTLNLTGGNVTIGAGGSGNLTVGVYANSTGTLNIGTGTTAGTLQAARVTAGNGTAIVNFNHTGNHSFGSILEGNLTVNKLGSGTTILDGNNTYTGGTFVNSGALQGNSQNLQGAISNNASVVFNQTTNGTYSGAMSGNGALSKIGNGTLTMSGNSSAFSGTAAINAGTVALTGSLANAAMAINNGATLTGNGTAGAVTINSGGTIAPGTSPGTLTTGNMTWNGGGTYAWELASANGTAGTGWDLISSNGSLTIGANATNKFIIAASTTNASGFNPNARISTWKIADFAGGITGFSSDAFSINATGFENLPAIYGFGVSTNGTALNFSYATIATWTGGSGNWTDTTNWQNGFAPINGVEVEYAGTNGTSSNDSTLAGIGGITFSNNSTGAFTLAGGGLTIGSGGIVNNSNSTQTIAINLALGSNQTFAANTANLVVSGNITGNASLNKAGNQTLTLSGSNTYSGGTTISSGTLSIGNGGTSGAITGNITNNAALVFNRSDASSYSGAISGTGTLEKLGAGTLTLTGNNSYSGGTTVSFGTLAVSSGSSISHAAADTVIGDNSGDYGTLVIDGGSASNDSGFVGKDAGSVGVVTMNSGAWTNQSNLSIGQSGNGTLNLNGGNLSSAGGDIGFTGAGQVNVSGGSWTNSADLYVGNSGSGSLTISGGDVSNAAAYVGNSPGGNGSVSISSGTWTNSAMLTIGGFGHGDFVITGGDVSNTLARLGFRSGGSGSAKISGGTWTNSSGLMIGFGGDGDLTLTGGTVIANGGAGNLTLAFGPSSTGTLNIGNGTTAGVLQAARVTGGNGTAIVNFNHNGSHAFSSILEGNLTVNLLGTGTTTLSGNNTYTGGTFVNAGTLEGDSQSLQGAISNNASVVFNQTANGTYAGIMSGNGTLSKIGSGSLTLSGNNTFTGGTTVDAGTLVTSGIVGDVTNSANFVVETGGAAGAVTNLATGSNNGTVASLSNLGTFTSSGNITGDVMSFNGLVTIGQSGRVSGNTTIAGGELVVAGAVSNVSNNAILRVETGGTAGAITNLGNGLATNNGTIASLLTSGIFTNSGNITGGVTSFGTLESSGAIGGSLIVGGGVTTINGTVAGATTVTAGILAGTGTVGDVVINSGGAIAPGNSPGTITTGNMTWNGGGIYKWQTLSLNGSGIAGSDWDLISSGGSLTINATANSTVGIRVTSLSGNLTDDIKKAQWEIGSFNGGITGYNKSFFSVNSTGMGARGRFFVTTEQNNLMLNYKTAAVWLGGTGNWTTLSEWEDNFRPENEDLVEFSGAGGTSTNNFASGNLSEISGIAFTSLATGSYTVNGNALAIGEDGILNDSTFEQTIALNLTGGAVLGVNAATSNLTISGVISGNSALTKTGNKTLTLNGNNNYSGGTNVSAGTLAGTTDGLKGLITNNAVVNFDQSFDGTYAGVLSGTGTLVKTGSGVVTLSGNNTFTGGTTINSGVLAAAVVSGNLVTLNPNAFGSGGVNINAGGAMLVPSISANVTNLRINGDLTLNNGTIAYYDIGTSPRGQDLRIDVTGNFTNAGNGVVFDFSQVEALDSGNYTLVSYNGTNFATSAISSRAGVGTTLQGSFDFSEDGKSLIYKVVGAQSSGTDIQNNGGPNTPIVANYNVSGPTITIGTNNTVAALTFNSGGSLNIQQNGVLNVSQGTLNVQNGISVVGGGTLVAPAGLNKDGMGELDITNNVIVTGTASVNAGLLSVNGQLQATGGVVVIPNAILGGIGVIVGNVDVRGGNLSPGNSPGTLTVDGNLVLTGANATIIEIESPTNYDRIVVSGEAALGGTLNAVAYGGGTITPGARYEFLQAGSITGEFDSLIAPEGLRVRFLNSGTIGTLLFGPGSYVPMALNPNQTSVAKALDSFITATDGDQLAVSIALDSLTTEQFPSAFDQIMPGFYESLADIVIEQTYNQAQLLTQRMGSLRLGAQGFQAMGISQPIKYDKDGTSAADAKTASPIVESAMATNWNSWVMANGEFSISRGLAGVPNYNNNAGGFLVGADYRLSENFAAGLFAGYEYSYAKYNGGSSTAGNSALFGLYGSYTHEDGYYADAIVSGGYTGFQTRRSIEFSTIDRTARANPNSGQFSAALNLGKDFEIGKFTLGPIIGAQYTYAGIGGFTETGADSLNLALGQQNANSLRSNLGARLAYNWEVGSNITLIPEVRAFWMHEFLNNPRNISSALDGGNGASFDYETEAPYRNSVFGGAGISAKVGDRWSASVFYNVNFGSENYTNNIISTSLGFSF